MTPRDTKVLSTYVTQPCDSHEPNTQMVGYTTIDVEVIVPDNQPSPSLQWKKTRLVTKTKSTSSFGGAWHSGPTNVK